MQGPNYSTFFVFAFFQMKINAYCYFALLAVSGAFAVTFSVVFAYVADVTEEADRRSLATTFAILLNIFDLPREQINGPFYQGRYCALLFLVATPSSYTVEGLFKLK